MAKDKLEIEIIANDKASGTLHGLSGTIGNFAKTAGAAFAGVGVAAVAGLGAVIKGSISTNAVLETSTLQFETLLGSADAAQQHIANLYEFAAKTPFETAPIIEASRLLETFGGSALDTMDNMKLVGDAAAVAGRDISDVAMWFGRAYVAIDQGKPFGEAAMRLQEMGILSGEGRAKIEELQKAGASTAETWAALQAEFARFDGAMEKQAGTWEGLVSTIKDNLELAIGTGFKPFFDAIKDILAQVAEFVQTDEFMAAASAMATSLVPLAASFGAIGQQLFTDVLPALMGGIIEPLLTLATTVGPPVLQVLGVLISSFATLAGPVLSAFSAAMVPLITAVLPILQSLLPAIAQALGQLITAFLGLVPALLPLLPPLLQIITTILPQLATLFTQVIGVISALVSDALAMLVPVVIQAVEAFLPLVDQVLVGLIPLVMQVIEAFAPLIAQILPPVIQLLSALIPVISVLITAILPVVISLLNIVISVVTPIIQALLPVFIVLVDALTGAFEMIMTPLKDFSNWILNKVIPAIDGISRAIQPVIDWLGRMRDTISNIKLPDWLTPGSPTPFEIGLVGIKDAMKQLVIGPLPQLASQLEVVPSAMGGAFAPAAAAVAGGPTVYVTLQMTSAVSLADMTDAERKLQPMVTRLVRKALA